MDFYDIGFSNIRFASDNANYIHKHNYRINVFSEEVFIHEFIHTLERTSKEHGYKTIDLHDNEKYGYEDGGINGLSEWYEDYLKCEILDKETNQYVGLNEAVYSYKPVNETNFRFPLEVDFNTEPSNIFEEIKSLFDVVADAI